MSFHFQHTYQFQQGYETPVAYFCMEFAIHQPLKTYAGGLGYLAGSHMRSAIVKNSMQDVTPYFDSNRMVKEYNEKFYLKI